jgi:hypothetical protein
VPEQKSQQESSSKKDSAEQQYPVHEACAKNQLESVIALVSSAGNSSNGVNAVEQDKVSVTCMDSTVYVTLRLMSLFRIVLCLNYSGAGLPC